MEFLDEIIRKNRENLAENIVMSREEEKTYLNLLSEEDKNSAEF